MHGLSHQNVKRFQQWSAQTKTEHRPSSSGVPSLTSTSHNLLHSASFLACQQSHFCQPATKTQRTRVCMQLCAVSLSVLSQAVRARERERKMSPTKWQQDDASIPPLWSGWGSWTYSDCQKGDRKGVEGKRHRDLFSIIYCDKAEAKKIVFHMLVNKCSFPNI